MSEPVREESAFDEFLAEVFGASERAGAIVGAAQVEDALAAAIHSRLIMLDASDYKLVFERSDAPLSTFHAKIQIGYALALYEDAVRADLTTVKNVRNRFAHTISARSFDDDQIAKLCAKLHYPSAKAAIRAEDEKALPRDRFQTTVGQLYFGLSMIANTRASPTPPDRWNELLRYPKRP